MRVFVTGATGFIGSAIVTELLSAGHEVLGLARSDTSARTLAGTGAKVQCGTLEDHDSLRRGAAYSDAVIHTAFNHDFSRFAENCELDQQAIEVLGTELQGSRRPMIVTGGLAFGLHRHVMTEADIMPPPSREHPRASETAAISLSNRGVRAAVIRLPQVHNRDRHGLINYFVQIAREQGVSVYVGDGSNRWAAAHLLDAARLYRLVLEHDRADGPYHAVAEEGIAFRDIAEIIGRQLDVPVVSKSAEQALEHFGPFGAAFAGMSGMATSERTQARLGWQPESQCGLLHDLERASYFEKPD